MPDSLAQFSRCRLLFWGVFASSYNFHQVVRTSLWTECKRKRKSRLLLWGVFASSHNFHFRAFAAKTISSSQMTSVYRWWQSSISLFRTQSRSRQAQRGACSSQSPSSRPDGLTRKVSCVRVWQRNASTGGSCPPLEVWWSLNFGWMETCRCKGQRLFSLKFFNVLCNRKLVFQCDSLKLPHVSVKHDSSAQPAWAIAKFRNEVSQRETFIVHLTVATPYSQFDGSVSSVDFMDFSFQPEVRFGQLILRPAFQTFKNFW